MDIVESKFKSTPAQAAVVEAARQGAGGRKFDAGKMAQAAAEEFKKSRGKSSGGVRRGGDGGCEGFPLRINGSGGGRAANIQDFKARQTLAFLRIDIHISTRRLSLP